jgi:hypothetical protein
MDKQIKVGDKVKATDKASNWSDITPGNVYEVQNVYGETVEILDDVGDHNVLSEDEYELVPQKPFQAGDIVTPNASERDRCFTSGRMYTVSKVRESRHWGGQVIYLTDDTGNLSRFRNADFWDLVSRPAAEQPEPQQQDIYLVSGFASEFPTQGAAEQYVESIGDNGEEYRIAKLVRTVKVSRKTVVTLEDA